MKQCSQCQGLVPEALTRCPNCEVTSKRTGLKVAIAGGLIAFASSCGPPAMAIYGVACTGKQVDGGTNGCGGCDTVLADGGNPAKDPTNQCFKDGGTP